LALSLLRSVSHRLSAIETCRANGIQAADYLVQVMNNAHAARDNPAQWLPWKDEAQASCS
jgi:hypothetical protein